MLVEIYPYNKSGRKFAEGHFDGVIDYGKYIDWEEEGDEYVVVLNTENNREAVYTRYGTLLCAMNYFDLFVSVDTADDSDKGVHKQIRQLLIDDATALGFPCECPVRRGMTWRELADEILSHPEALDMEALVWMHEEDFYMGGHEIVGVTPYYSDESVSENNKLSIDIR